MNGWLQSVRRFFTVLLGGAAMLVVALVCAFISLRIAIHGREVAVPNLSGMSDSDAEDAARDLGLNLSVENRFYSPAVAQNHVLSQSPAPGSRVRRGWEVRVTESLGPQNVSVPDVTGQEERPASLVLRRLQLDTGSVAHLPAPAPAGIILAQSPQANSKGMSSPHVALLVSDEEPETAETEAYVMPSLVGLTMSQASLRLATAGLHIGSAVSPEQAPADPTADAPVVQTSAITIVAQTPLPGKRITRVDTIRVTLSR